MTSAQRAYWRDLTWRYIDEPIATRYVIAERILTEALPHRDDRDVVTYAMALVDTLLGWEPTV